MISEASPSPGGRTEQGRDGASVCEKNTFVIDPPPVAAGDDEMEETSERTKSEVKQEIRKKATMRLHSLGIEIVRVRVRHSLILGGFLEER